MKNKTDIMIPMLMHDADIFMGTEMKLDYSLQVSQFDIECFSVPVRLD